MRALGSSAIGVNIGGSLRTRGYIRKKIVIADVVIAIDFRNNLDNLAASGDISPQENADEFASNHGRWLVLDDA